MSTLKLKNVQFSAELTRLFTRLILSNSLNWYASANLRLTEIFVLCWLENLHRKKKHCARCKVASLQVALTTPTKPASEDTISNHIQCFQQAIVLNVLNRFHWEVQVYLQQQRFSIECGSLKWAVVKWPSFCKALQKGKHLYRGINHVILQEANKNNNKWATRKISLISTFADAVPWAIWSLKSHVIAYGLDVGVIIQKLNETQSKFNWNYFDCVSSVGYYIPPK